MREESISRMPAVGQGPVKKLAIKLQVFQKGKKKYALISVRGANKNPTISSVFFLSNLGAEEHEVLSLIAQHSTKWGFWFKRIGTRLKFVFLCSLLTALTLQDVLILCIFHP